MSDIFRAVERLRTAMSTGNLDEQPLQSALPRIYPVACALLSNLDVGKMRSYLQRHAMALPSDLITCRDRKLRGGIVARYGYALLFADSQDTEAEIRFTLAHEAKHFLMDHLYPRLDLIERFGHDIVPVLDGRRPPTREERVDALLARTELTQHTHLLDRDTVTSRLLAIEADADAFACELLAPQAALHSYFPTLLADEEAVSAVQRVLTRDFGLPDAPALKYARTWVTENGEPLTLLHRLRLI